MDTLPEIKIFIQPTDLIPAELESSRNSLLTQAVSATQIVTADQNDNAGQIVIQMRKHVKQLDEMRKKITTPLDDAKKIVKEFFDNHCADLSGEIIRLKKLGGNFIESENRRVALEEQKKRDEFLAAQKKQFEFDEAAKFATTSFEKMMANHKLESAKAEVQSIIATPEPVMEKAKGQTMKQVLRYEVTDIFELVKARPDLCRIEAKASAINSTCHPNLPVPGLKLWFENQSTYTTR